MGPWFGRKRIGWGARPVTWQGWLVTVVYLGSVFAAARYLAHTDRTLFVVAVVALTAIYLLIARATYGD
jgi:signal transduction histidine kinase